MTCQIDWLSRSILSIALSMSQTYIVDRFDCRVGWTSTGRVLYKSIVLELSIEYRRILQLSIDALSSWFTLTLRCPLSTWLLARYWLWWFCRLSTLMMPVDLFVDCIDCRSLMICVGRSSWRWFDCWRYCQMLPGIDSYMPYQFCRYRRVRSLIGSRFWRCRPRFTRFCRSVDLLDCRVVDLSIGQVDDGICWCCCW